MAVRERRTGPLPAYLSDGGPTRAPSTPGPLTRVGGRKVGTPATSPDFMPFSDYVDPVFNHPGYEGTDPAYAAWLSQADLAATDATSTAKRRRADAHTAYQQAMADLATDATNQRRNLQTSMLSRGMFRSGEFGRRGQELNSAFDQAGTKAQGALTTTIGDINDTERSAISSLGMQGTTQVSQAMLRDAVAAYNAQQAAIEAPAAAVAPAAPSYTPPPAAPRPYAAPANHPVINSSAALYAAQTPPKPKPSGQTGALAQKRSGLQ